MIILFKNHRKKVNKNFIKKKLNVCDFDNNWKNELFTSSYSGEGVSMIFQKYLEVNIFKSLNLLKHAIKGCKKWLIMSTSSIRKKV